MRTSVVILGVPVDDVTMEEAVDEIVEFVRAGRETGRWHQVTTVNLDFVTNAVTDGSLRSLLQGAALNIPDGMPIVWAAKALGVSLRGRVAGVDLVESLAARAAAGELRMHLFGGAPGVAAEAASRLQQRHPGAQLTHGAGGAPFADVADMDPTQLDEIRAADPDVLCVALGNPKQERWIEHYGPQLRVPVLIGVGGTLDFIVGRRHRAPDWMRRSGLEWVARMVQEPARLGPRYLRDAVVCVPRFAAQWWRERGRHGAPAWRAAVVHHPDARTVMITAGPSLDVRRDTVITELDLRDTTAVSVDVAAIERADARTVGALVSLARASEHPLEIAGLGPQLRHDLDRAGVLSMLVSDGQR